MRRTLPTMSAFILVPMLLGLGISDAFAILACSNDTGPASSCSSLVIGGSNLTITIPNGVTVLGSNDSIQVQAGSTGLNLTIATGAVIADDGNGFSGIKNSGSISSITNLGQINYTPGIKSINNLGTISTINNLQGSAKVLLYTGALPSFYNIVIASSSNYGQLRGLGAVSGTTTFGISSLSAGSSIVSGTAYAEVLRGVSSAQLGLGGATTFSGISNGYSYTLTETNVPSGIWSLTVTAYSSGGSGGGSAPRGGGSGGGSRSDLDDEIPF